MVGQKCSAGAVAPFWLVSRTSIGCSAVRTIYKASFSGWVATIAAKASAICWGILAILANGCFASAVKTTGKTAISAAASHTLARLAGAVAATRRL